MLDVSSEDNRKDSIDPTAMEQHPPEEVLAEPAAAEEAAVPTAAPATTPVVEDVPSVRAPRGYASLSTYRVDVSKAGVRNVVAKKRTAN